MLPIFLATLPTVGFGKDPEGPLKRSKLQQYFAEALAQESGDRAGRRSAAMAAAELDARALLQLLPEDSVCKHALAAEQQQRRQQEQQCAHSAAGVSSTASGGSAAESRSSAAGSGAGGGRRGRGEGRLSSPTAIASPRAPSLSTATTRSLGSPPDTAAATPEACAGLAQASADGAHSAHASASMPSTPRTALTPASSFSLGEGGLQERGGEGGPDLRFVIQRLRAPHVTGQVCAWGWEHAARLSHKRRSMPAELFAALWAATEACPGRWHPQDVLGTLEAWLTLMQTCHRHFRLRVSAVETLATHSVPLAVKRMTEDQLGQLATLCAEIALHRSDTTAETSGKGASARDLVQPLFALSAAEVAWRCSNPLRYVSVHTLAALDDASGAWRWKVVRHRDSRQLAALKEATAAALALVQGHIPG